MRLRKVTFLTEYVYVTTDYLEYSWKGSDILEKLSKRNKLLGTSLHPRYRHAKDPSESFEEFWFEFKKHSTKEEELIVFEQLLKELGHEVYMI
jgi:hypothetical protein